MNISPKRREEIIDALRRGTVPRSSLDALAVGLEAFDESIDEELTRVKTGSGVFKAVRGEYGCGKTFFARWICDRARKKGFVTAEVQISETETPLHKLETVYRRLIESLATADTESGALRNLVDSWFFTLEEDVLAEGNIDEKDSKLLLERTNELVEKRLQKISDQAPAFSAALRGYRTAQGEGKLDVSEALLAWLGGQPNIATSAKRYAGIKGDLDHFGALGFLQGLLYLVRDSGHAGLLIVLDEVETIQRMRSDVRGKSLNALRQLIDEVDSGRFPGLYLLVTGTSAFFEGPQGVSRLEPLAQRLQVDFQTDARFDNPRAVQIRLSPFALDKLTQVGARVRDIYLDYSNSSDRIGERCSDDYISELAEAVSGKLGGKVGIAPRIFLKKLVADILDRIDQFDDFDPHQHYSLTLNDSELTLVERQAVGIDDIDDIELDV